MNPKSESPPMTVHLQWTGEERFQGKVDATPIVLSGNGPADLSPMQAVLSGLAGCMGIDIAVILRKGRLPLEGLEIELRGRRAESEPRRFVAYEIDVRVTGPIEREKIERAVELSKEKYCSVWHSLRQDAPLVVKVA